MPITKISEEVLSYLRLLGVPTNATVSDVDNAFNAKVSGYHSDQNEDNKAPLQATLEELTHARDELTIFFKTNQSQVATVDTNHLSLATDSLADYQTTSADYFDALEQYHNGKVYSSLLRCEDGIPLDKEHTFYLFCPHSILQPNPQLRINPYDFGNNVRNMRAAELFSSLEQQQKAIMDELWYSSKFGNIDSFQNHLQKQHYIPNGVIYAFHGCARVVIDCFVRGGGEPLIPLMTGYYLQQLRSFTREQQNEFRLVMTSRWSSVNYKQYIDYFPPPDQPAQWTSNFVITGDISIDVIKAILARNQVLTDSQGVIVSVPMPVAPTTNTEQKPAPTSVSTLGLFQTDVKKASAAPELDAVSNPEMKLK